MEGNYKGVMSMVLLMLILTVLSVVAGNNFVSSSIGDSYSAIVNGTTSDYSLATDGFIIDEYAGAIGWLVIIIVIGVAAGIMVLGSGFSEVSVNLLYKGIFYGALWGIVSIYPAPLMFSIYLFGPIFYITLTIIYVVLVMMVM